MTRGRSLLAVVVATVLTASNLYADEKIYWEEIARIRAEGFRRSQVMDIAGYLSDVIGARLAGSPNSRQAQEWAAIKLEEFGLVNVALEPFGEPVPSWEVEYVSVHLLTPDYQSVIGYPKALTPGTDGRLRGRATIAHIETEKELDQYRGKLADAFVLTAPQRSTPPRFTPEAWRHDAVSLANIVGFGQQPSRPEEPRDDVAKLTLEERLTFFRAEGVAVLLEPGGGDDGTVLVEGRPTTGEDRTPLPPAQLVPMLTLAAEHYNRIHRVLERGVPVEMEIEIRTRLHGGARSRNVIGEIAGTDLKDEVVMIGAHLDSWHAGTGATDNAAGCAVAMEAMRILVAAGAQPRRTIRVGLWDHEEGGRKGSAAYVAEHFGNPRDGVKPGYDEFSGYFNMDVGSGQFRGLFLQEIEQARPIFEAWMKPFFDLGMVKLTFQNTGGTDHLSFAKAGLPGWQFIQDEIDYENRIVHTNMDVYDKLIERDLMINAVIMASFAYQAAMRDERLPRKPIPAASEQREGSSPQGRP